jgi:hypothetical protein
VTSTTEKTQMKTKNPEAIRIRKYERRYGTMYRPKSASCCFCHRDADVAGDIKQRSDGSWVCWRHKQYREMVSA